MSVHKTIDSAGRPRWVVRWREPGRRNPRRRTFNRKVDADRFEATTVTDQLRGTYIDPDAGKITLRSYAEGHWLVNELKHVRPNTRAAYRQHLRRHVIPEFGDVPLVAVKRERVQRWVGRLERDGLAPVTIANIVAVLRNVLQTAVDDGRIAKNEARRLSLPTVAAHQVVPLSAEQVIRVAEAILPRYRLAVILGVGLGLREGEALGVTEGCVDFLKRRAVYVARQAQNGALAEVKTRASKAWVPADDVVLAEISAHIAAFGTGVDGVLIHNRGRVVRRSWFGKCWRRAVVEAGLPEGTRFHDLRHTFASVQIARNMHPKVIQTLMRHATMAETMDTYGHLFPDAEGAGRGVMDTFLTRPSDTTATPARETPGDAQ